MLVIRMLLLVIRMLMLVIRMLMLVIRMLLYVFHSIKISRMPRFIFVPFKKKSRFYCGYHKIQIKNTGKHFQA